MACKDFKIGKPTTKTRNSSRTKRQRAPPRQDSPNANDRRNRTSYIHHQAGWSWENLPEIVYQLNPLEKDTKTGTVGTLPYKIHGKNLRNFSVLPDNISSAVEEFRVEAWQRMDNRICLHDITDRMHPDFRIKNNALQQRGVRFRQAFWLKAWRSGNKRSQELVAVIENKMKSIGLSVSSNSTRGLTPGLVNPKVGESGGRVDFPASWKSRKLGDKNKFPEGILAEPAPQPLEAESSTPASSYASSEDSESVYQESDVSSDASDVPSDVSETSSDVSSETISEDLDFLPEASDCEVPKTPEFFEQEAQIINFTHEYAPYDEPLEHPAGALQVISGLIPDQDLPKTVSMLDLELFLKVGQPTPEIAPDNEDLPLIKNPDRIEYRAPKWTPSSAISHRSFCSKNSFCSDIPAQYEEPISHNVLNFPDFASALGKPQSPSTENFPFYSPIQLNSFPEDKQKNIFDDMLNEYYKGEYQLSEMPYYDPEASV